MFVFLKHFLTSPIFPILTIVLLHTIKNETVTTKAEIDSLNQTSQHEENLNRFLKAKWTEMTTIENLKELDPSYFNVQPLTGKQIKPLDDIKLIPQRQPLQIIR